MGEESDERRILTSSILLYERRYLELGRDQLCGCSSSRKTSMTVQYSNQSSVRIIEEGVHNVVCILKKK